MGCTHLFRKINVAGSFAFCIFLISVSPMNPQNSKKYSAPKADKHKDCSYENNEYGLKPSITALNSLTTGNIKSMYNYLIKESKILR